MYFTTVVNVIIIKIQVYQSSNMYITFVNVQLLFSLIVFIAGRQISPRASLRFPTLKCAFAILIMDITSSSWWPVWVGVPQITFRLCSTAASTV